MRLLKVLIPCTLALLVVACGRVETREEPISTISPLSTTAEAPATDAPGGTPAATQASGASTNAAGGPTQVDPSKIVTTQSGLKYADLKEGSGAEATAGKQVTVHYTGWLQDGTKFDSSRDRGEPLPLTLGAGQVIPGWDEGLVGMKVGGQRQLIIPPQLAYGQNGTGPIPPNATLVFDVEVVQVG